MTCYRLTVTHRERPRIGWIVWDAGWLVFEAFYAGWSFARERWWQFGFCLVFVLAFLTLMLLHIRTTQWDEYSMSRWVDDDAIDS